MDKPKIYTTVRHPMWGTETRIPSFHTAHGYHAEFQQWAKSQEKPDLYLSVECDDGSRMQEFAVFTRIQKQVSYYVPWDEETYEVEVDTNKFNASFLADYIPDYDHEKGVVVAKLKAAMQLFIEDDNESISMFKFTTYT